MSRNLGSAAEMQACNYLISHGLKLVTSNFQCRCGEIDLIMYDQQYLVFIEVRARKSTDFGGGIASVTHAKIQKIYKTANIYLQIKNLGEKQPIRFDIVSFDGHPPKINWIQNAFGF